MMGEPDWTAKSIALQILRPCILPSEPPATGEILGVGIHRAAFDRAIAGHHAVAEIFLVAGLQRVVLLQGERLQLVECAGIQQQFQPLTGSQLTFGVLLGDAVLTTAEFCLGAISAQFEDAGIFFRHTGSSPKDMEF